jgi:hypothetical protein
MKSEFNLDDLDPESKFMFIATIKVAIFFKNSNKTKEEFLEFCGEIWNSMEANDPEILNDIIQQSMQRDLKNMGVKLPWREQK